MEGFVKSRLLGTRLSFWFKRPRVGPRICVSNVHPGDADLATPGTTLWKPLPKTTPQISNCKSLKRWTQSHIQKSHGGGDPLELGILQTGAEFILSIQFCVRRQWSAQGHRGATGIGFIFWFSISHPCDLHHSEGPSGQWPKYTPEGPLGPFVTMGKWLKPL